jgi:glycogen operon protein
LGRSFPGFSWLQWNGQFRDDVRSFLRGDNSKVSAVISRVYGSDDLFPDQVTNAYHAYQSVNFVSCHDGFTMYDVVSYNEKRNEANGHNNHDGTDTNLSWNCGWEGDDDVPADVLALRKRQIKNYCCLLFLSNGTPMFGAGDEFMRTQAGNNNPYNQDNETSWLNWAQLEKNSDMFRFFQYMIAFRKAHPSLCRSRFWRDEVRWYGSDAQVDQSPDAHSFAFFLSGKSQQDADLYVMVNAAPQDITFHIQHGESGGWKRVVDTSLESPEDIVEPGQETPVDGLDCVVKSRSTIVLMR